MRAPRTHPQSIPQAPQLTTSVRLGRLEGLQEKEAWVCLLPHFRLMTTSPPTLTRSLPQCSLADCHQWAGPVAALTRS